MRGHAIRKRGKRCRGDVCLSLPITSGLAYLHRSAAVDAYVPRSAELEPVRIPSRSPLRKCPTFGRMSAPWRRARFCTNLAAPTLVLRPRPRLSRAATLGVRSSRLPASA